MKARIVERFCEGKYRDDRNEDAMVVTDDFAAVVDGSTAAGPIGGEPGGRLAARLVCEVLHRLPPSADAMSFVAEATEALREAGARHGVTPPFAAATVLSFARREIWRIGDCPFAIDGAWSIADHFPHERAYFAFRRMIVRGYRDLGRPGDAAPALEQVTRDWLEMTRGWLNAQNHPMSFGALGGLPVPARFVEVFPVVRGIREIALASDGAIVSAEGQRGPASVAEMLARIDDLKVRDPGCVVVRLLARLSRGRGLSRRYEAASSGDRRKIGSEQ